MGSPHPSYSSVPEVSIYRPLQRFFLQQIIQQFNETDPDIPVPSNLDELKTSHFYQTQREEEADKKRTLCDFFIKEARKNINRSVGPLNRRCLYLWLWKPFKNHKNSRFKINDKYLELLFAFFEVPFVFSDIEDYLDHRQHNLKNDYNQDIRDEELLEQIEEFKKIEQFQRQEFYYRCYISDVSGITKGILLVERDFQNDSLLASLTIQRQSDNPSMEGNEIEYSGTLEEGGGFAYLDFKNREPNKSRAFWILRTYNNSFASLKYLTGTFNAVDKAGISPVAGELLLELTDKPEDMEDGHFFTQEPPFQAFARLSGRKFSPPVDEVYAMQDLASLIDAKVQDFSGLYRCYFLSMRADLLRECIYHIAPTGKVLGKVSRGSSQVPATGPAVYEYEGLASMANGYIKLKIKGGDGDNYQVLLYNPNKAHPKVYYGIYYGWDDSGRLRAGREVFIPCSKDDSFIKLLPQNHTKGSDTYNKLCQDYQIDDFFDNYRFSQMPKMPNWLAKQEDELKGREPIPSFLEGHYYSYHLSPAKTDHAPYNKPIARDLLTIEPNGEVVLAIKDNQTLRGKAFKIDRFLYLSVKANDRHRFSIYLINTLKQYNDVIIGLNLEVNEQVETIVSSREILFRRTADAEDTADLLPIDPELIGRLNQMQPGASEYLTGPTDNYIRLPRVPVSKGKKLAKHFDYGKVYFYAACYSALAEEDITTVNKLLAEAFRHGFDDLGRLAHEKAQGTLRPFDKSLLIPKEILQKLTEYDRAKEDASYSLSPSARVWQIPFRGKYNPEFIQKIFELYSQTKHELHIIGEVAQHISGHNTELVEQLEGTLRRLLEKDPDITIHRYQTATPVNEFWLKRLIALKQDFGDRFKLFGKKEESDLSNINIILIDPFYEQNTNIIIFTRDNTPTDDIPVPIFAVVEQNYKHLSDGLRSKVNKITRSFRALENEQEIRSVLG